MALFFVAEMWKRQGFTRVIENNSRKQYTRGNYTEKDVLKKKWRNKVKITVNDCRSGNNKREKKEIGTWLHMQGNLLTGYNINS